MFKMASLYQVEAEAGTTLGTPFKELVRLRAVEFWCSCQDDVKGVRDAVHDDGSSGSAVNAKVCKHLAAILVQL